MIETVSCCPICRSESSHRVFDAVPDFVFAASSETWPIDVCENCDSLFLRNRPDAKSIGKYYERYYTHTDEGEAPLISGLSVKSGAAKRLANSWRNYRYGSSRPSLGSLAALVVGLIPPLRGWIDAECRHLPVRTAQRDEFRVLDVGHGDARFLKFVREIGYTAAGLEVDPKAVAQAQTAQLDVHQGDIDAAELIWGTSHFDYITMSHVIEHVHDPRHVIEVASRLLRPGGRLWIECPNPQSPGLKRYGNRWRDLDPPRHICIPSLKALQLAASDFGLVIERQSRRPFVPFEVYPFSAVAVGEGVRSGYITAARAELAALFAPDRREWLTLTFLKPAAKSEPNAKNPFPA